MRPEPAPSQPRAIEPTRPLTAQWCGSAGALLADAFFDNPAHVYICPDPRSRRARLRWFLGSNLRMHVTSAPSRSFCLLGDGAVDAMGFWTHSGWPPLRTGVKLRAGLLEAPLRFGLSGFRRLLEAGAEIERLRDRALAGRPFWYLNNMAVRERLRGSGIGSRILTEQLAIVRAADPAAAIALSTQRTENVRFYGRLGFEVVSDDVIGRSAHVFRNWIMVAEPAQS